MTYYCKNCKLELFCDNEEEWVDEQDNRLCSDTGRDHQPIVGE